MSTWRSKAHENRASEKAGVGSYSQEFAATMARSCAMHARLVLLNLDEIWN